MTHKTMKRSFETHIPRELLAQILAKLPPKSILRFRSVLKAWCALIDSRFFKDHHLDFINTCTINDCKYLLHFDIKNNHPSIMQTAFLMGAGAIVQNINNPPCLDVQYQLGLHGCRISKSDTFIESEGKDQFRSKILGPVNGIYCVMIEVGYYNRCTLILWNPGIQQFHVLPRLPPPVLPPKLATYFDNHVRENQSLFYGLGYDPSTDDYKIILMTELGDTCYETYIHYCFHLYTLATNVWKQLDPLKIDPSDAVIVVDDDGVVTFVDDISHTFNGDNEVGVYSNGACHWYSPRNKSILSFNFGDSTFKVSPIPQEIMEANQRYPKLATTHGCLVLVYPIECTDYKTRMRIFNAYDVYVMRGNMMERLWMKAHRIDVSDSPSGRFLGIVGDEFFVRKDVYYRSNVTMTVVSYSLGTSERRKEHFEYGDFKNPRMISVLPYQESIISVTPHQK